jgi:hypothetical protein
MQCNGNAGCPKSHKNDLHKNIDFYTHFNKNYNFLKILKVFA